jgi:predicted ester cyclase
MEVVKQFYTHLDKFLNQEDQNAFINLWTSDSKRFGGSSDESMSIKDMTPFLTMYYTAFPDLKHQIVNMIADSDFVVVQVNYSGTQVGKFMGILPTHRKIDCKGVHIFKINADKVAELHFLDDDFAMFSQLGHQPK